MKHSRNHDYWISSYRRSGKRYSVFAEHNSLLEMPSVYERGVRDVHRTHARESKSTHGEFFCNQAQNY